MGIEWLLCALAVAPWHDVERPEPARWGRNGHRIVAAVAAQYLTPQAREVVADLLDGHTMAEVANWADRVRGDSDSPWVGISAPWHWVTVPDGHTYASSDRNPDGDVVAALRRFEAVLRSPEAPRAERIDALRFVIHFVGDLHQPLHVGRGDDRGGNDVAVRWFGRSTNLHAVWDTEIQEWERLSFTEFAAFLERPTPDQIRAWQRDEYAVWVEEAKALRSTVYDLPAADGGPPALGWGYHNRAIGPVRARLLRAGVRLAGVLNAALDPDG